MTSKIDPKNDEQSRALLETVEQLREQQFPHLSADLVRNVLRIHSSAAAGEVDLVRAVEEAVEQHLAKVI
jgi:hypothetical protein